MAEGSPGELRDEQEKRAGKDGRQTRKGGDGGRRMSDGEDTKAHQQRSAAPSGDMQSEAVFEVREGACAFRKGVDKGTVVLRGEKPWRTTSLV